EPFLEKSRPPVDAYEPEQPPNERRFADGRVSTGGHDALQFRELTLKPEQQFDLRRGRRPVAGPFNPDALALRPDSLEAGIKDSPDGQPRLGAVLQEIEYCGIRDLDVDQVVEDTVACLSDWGAFRIVHREAGQKPQLYTE